MRVFRCRRRFDSGRLLDAVRRRLDAPLDFVPPGMLTPYVARILFEAESMQRLLRLQEYLLIRLSR